MKKITSLLFAMLLACATNLWAETVTYQHVFNAKPSTGDKVTLSGVNWNITATSLGAYNSNNYAGVQLGSKNGNGEITLTSSSDWNNNGKTKITEVRLWLNLGGTSVTPSVTIGGKAAKSDGTTVTKNSTAGTDWTKATKVTFTPAADGNTGVVVINVTSVKAGYICAMEIDSELADPDAPNAPNAPTISGESTFHGSTEVTITADENLKIYYTTNGDDPTTASTPYTAPFSITATTTVKAIAVNETTSSVSAVAEKTFTHQDAVTLAAIDYTTDGTKVYLKSVTVVYANGSYTYLKDETGVGLLYGGDFNLTAGDIVAGIAATTKVYNKLPELLPAVTFEELTVTSGEAPSPAEAKAVPTAEEVNTYLLLKSITLAADAATKDSGSKLQNITVPFKDGTIDLRDQFGVVTDGTIQAGTYDIEGFVSVFNTVQFYITKITSTATAIDNAVIETPAVKTIENGQLIILRDGVKYNAMGVRLQ